MSSRWHHRLPRLVLLSLAAQAEHRHGTLWPGPSDRALPWVELSMSKAEVLSPRPAFPRAPLPSFSNPQNKVRDHGDKHRVSQKLLHRTYRLLNLHVTLGEKQPGSAASCGPLNNEREPYPFTFGLWRAVSRIPKWRAKPAQGWEIEANPRTCSGEARLRCACEASWMSCSCASQPCCVGPGNSGACSHPSRVVWDCSLSLSRDYQCVNATAMRPPRSSNHERRDGWGLVRLRFATGRISSVVHQMRSEARGEEGAGSGRLSLQLATVPAAFQKTPWPRRSPLACTLRSKLMSCGWLWIWGTRETHGARGPQPPGGGQTEDLVRGGSKNEEGKLICLQLKLHADENANHPLMILRTVLRGM